MGPQSCDRPGCTAEATNRHCVGKYPQRRLWCLCDEHFGAAIAGEAPDRPVPTTPAEVPELVLDPKLTIAFCTQVCRILDIVKEHPEIEAFAREIVRDRQRIMGARRAQKTESV